MSTPTAPDDALNPGEAYRRRVSRALWFRHPTRPSRFLFAPDSPMGLFIDPLGKAGTVAFATQIKALKAQGLHMTAGALLVDDEGRCVFCAPGGTLDLLRTLADWARKNSADMPAVANLIDAGVARVQLDLGKDEAIKAIQLDQIEIQREPGIWDDLLQPTVATVAAVLEGRTPGERMWFWLCDDVPADVVPLLVQPVAWDLNRDRLDHLIGQVEAAGAGEAATGSCLIVDDGRMQFLSADLRPAMLAALADWVRANAPQAPGLTRLWNCRLLRTDGGIVKQVIEDPALWADVPRPVVPGTLAETAFLLEQLKGGEECWFWLTAHANDGPFLGLARLDADPDGADFKERVAGFYKRFPNSFQDALTGLVRRLPSGEVLFSTQDAHVEQWPAAIQALLDKQAAAHPGLKALAGAALVEIQGGKVSRTLAVPAAGKS
jgi:hypothetical protein